MIRPSQEPLILKVVRQHFPQAVSSPEKLAFDSRNREFENVRHFLVRHLFVSTKNHGKPLFFGKAGNGVIDHLPHLHLRQLLVRLGIFVGACDRTMPRLFLFFDGGFLATGFLGSFVKDQIAGDGEEEGGEFGGGLISLGGFPDSKKNLLGDVFSVSRAIGHLCDRSDDGSLVLFHEETKGFVVATGDAGHPGHVFIVGVLNFPHEFLSGVNQMNRQESREFPRIYFDWPVKEDLHTIFENSERIAPQGVIDREQ